MREHLRYYVKPASLAFKVGLLWLLVGLAMVAAILTGETGIYSILGGLFGGPPFDLVLKGLAVIGGRAALGGKVPTWL